MPPMEHVNLARPCDVVKIPSGERVTLPVGTECLITQALGGSFTVQVRSHGGLFRIAGADADALGKKVPKEALASTPTDADLEQRVEAALRTCYDPEIPVNIVDLGLVYDTRIAALDDGTSRIDIKMTLTAQGCGMGGAIAADAEHKLRGLAGVSDARVEIVWDPPWNPRMISEDGRRKLGI
ncbi:MAG TPA: putative Fe-S cluster assembly protein SufT [Candidatus Binatia bacterium]|nr:putative Fe-S cluster assembly protein SufT [Candidatus Binatia bacterium]